MLVVLKVKESQIPFCKSLQFCRYTVITERKTRDASQEDTSLKEFTQSVQSGFFL